MRSAILVQVFAQLFWWLPRTTDNEGHFDLLSEWEALLIFYKYGLLVLYLSLR